MGSSGRLRIAAEASTDKYRILAELGEGGMANVYLAVARGPSGFSKLLVLKAIRDDLASQPDLLAMFLDEARLAARLNHPNVVQTLEVSELRGRPVIVMEYLDGETLANILHKPESRDMPLPMKLRIVSAALDGLQYIHDLADFDGTPLELVHRDISPHNVFVTFDGQVKLLDFGIAKGLTSRSRTSTDVIKGKIRYMSPEQMSGEPCDRRADIFSMGVILWEIATGRRIWHGRTEVNVMHAVMNEGVPPPRSVEPSVPAALDDICVKALATSPDDRYRTAADLQADLEDALERMGSRATPKEIGKYLATAFATNRTRRREVIELELKKPDEAVEPSSGRFRFPPRFVSLSAAPLVDTGEPVASPHAQSRGWAALLAALVVGALVGGLLILRHPAGSSIAVGTGPAAASPSEPLNVPAATSQATAVPSSVLLRLAATPETAELFLDGKPLGSNPYVGVRPADDSPHTVRAEAPGYVTGTADISLDRDVKLVLPLVAAKALSAATAHRAPVLAPVAPSASAATPASSTNGNCTPPFYFDAQGIKRLKPECL
jgi:serine/threonine-protein kinase